MNNVCLHDFKNIGYQIAKVYNDIDQLRGDVMRIAKLMSAMYNNMEELNAKGSGAGRDNQSADRTSAIAS